MEKVVIIIPTYNEERVIQESLIALEQVFDTIDAARYDMQILVFDSHSLDNTVPVIKALQSTYTNIHVQSEPKKSGLGSAYIQAMHYALDKMNADIVFEFDADGSHQPKYLPWMLKCFDKGADVVVGSRYVKGGFIPDNWSFDRKFLSVMGNLVARIVLSFQYKDWTSGFRGTRANFLKKVDLDKLLSKQYAYKLDLFWQLHRLSANIIEFPIEFIDREKGYSKLPKNNVIDSLKVVFTLRLRALFKNA